METTRQQKIARLVQKELAGYFQRESRKYGGAMITVTKAHVTKDLSLARIYLSLFGVQDHDALIKLIRSHTKDIRSELAHHVKSQLRVIPNLEFHIDDSLDYIENIDRLLKQ